MVVLERLEVEKFRKLDLTLEFPEGMMIIKGPNEAGKSTILEAVLYALFGKTTRGTKDLAINHRSKTARVKLVFSVDDRKYLVERVLRKGEVSEARVYELLPNGARSPKASSVKRTNEFIEKLLGGLSFNEILVTNVVAQKELTKLVEMKGQDRDKIVNALLGLESVNKAVEKLQQERREKRKDLESKQILLSEVHKRLEAYRHDLEDLKVKSEELVKTEEKLLKSKVELGKIEQLYIIMKKYKEALSRRREIEARIEGLKKSQETRRSSLSQILQRIKLKKEEAERLKQLLKNIDSQVVKLREQLEKLKDLDNVQKKLKEAREILNEIDNTKARILETEKRINEIEKELEDLEGKISGYEVKWQEYQKLSKEIEKTKPSLVIFILLASLSILGLLNTALFSLGFTALAYYSVIQFKKNKLNEKAMLMKDELSGYEKTKTIIEQKKLELERLKSMLEKLHDSIETSKNKLRTYIEEIPQKYKLESWASIEDLIASIDAKVSMLQNEKIEAGKRLSQLEASRDEIKDRLSLVISEINDFEARRKELEDEIRSNAQIIIQLEKDLISIEFPSLPENLEFSEELYAELENKYTLLNANVHALKGEVEQLRRQIEELKKRIEDNKNVEEEYKKLYLEVEELKKLVQAQNLAIDSLRKIAEHIRERFLPAIQSNMNQIISIITGGRYKAVRLDSKYNIKVFDSDAGKFIEKDIFSGGTVDQLLLAMRLAFILSLLPETKKMYPRFLFLDEPLASSDSNRRKNILNLLTKTLNKQFRQIILITHLDVNIEDARIVRIEDGKILKS